MINDLDLMATLHVATGAIATLAGVLAIILRKGAGPHRATGAVFASFMIASALIGAWIAYGKPEWITAVAGVFTAYLIATSWLTLRRQGTTGALELLLLAIGAAVAGTAGWLGYTAVNSPDGALHGYAGEYFYFFAGLAGLGALLDLSILARRGVQGRHRIARHLWRMSLALFIAVGSLFTGPGAGVFPDWLRATGVLSAPEPIVLLIMVFWLVRVLFTKWADGNDSSVR